MHDSNTIKNIFEEVILIKLLYKVMKEFKMRIGIVVLVSISVSCSKSESSAIHSQNRVERNGAIASKLGNNGKPGSDINIGGSTKDLKKIRLN